MKRRDFTQMIIGGGLAATVPVPAAVAAPAAIERGAYTWAVAIAHAKSQVSPQMIVSRLGVSTGVARKIINRLAANGVVLAPNAAGVSPLAPPLLRVSSQVVSGGIGRSVTAAARGGGIEDRLKGFGKRLAASENEQDDAIFAETETVLDTRPDDQTKG